jgi:tol-pal system protein YbgF
MTAKRPGPTRWTSAWPPWKSASPTRRPPRPPPPRRRRRRAAPTSTDPGAAFKSARQLLLDGDYGGAEQAFAGYVEAFPDSAKAPEARYWLGETQFVREAYSDAAGNYLGAVRGWPQTSWAPDAVLKLSRSLVALKKPADACKTLDELTRRYPKAPTAITAKATSTRVQAKCAT